MTVKGKTKNDNMSEMSSFSILKKLTVIAFRSWSRSFTPVSWIGLRSISGIECLGIRNVFSQLLFLLILVIKFLRTRSRRQGCSVRHYLHNSYDGFSGRLNQRVEKQNLLTTIPVKGCREFGNTLSRRFVPNSWLLYFRIH